MALIQSLDANGENVEPLYEFVELNSYAVQYRYESLEASDDDRLDRAANVKRIEELHRRVVQLIGA